MGRTVRALVGLAAVVVAGCVATGQSRQKVAVAPFIGNSVDEFQAQVTELLSSTEWELVPADDYIWTARELDATTSGEKDVARVAQKMQLSAVVYGKLIKKGKRRATLHIVVHNESGEVVERFKLKVRRGKLSKKGVKLMNRRVLAALDGLAPVEMEMEPEPESQVAEKPAKPAPRWARKKSPKKTAKPKSEKRPVATTQPTPKKVAKKPAKKPAPKKVATKKKPRENPNKTRGKDLELEVDDSGQVADDEWPSDLK